MTAGYSGTPLAKKLTLKDGFRCWFDAMPPSIREEIEAFGLDLQMLSAPENGMNAAHIFVTEADELSRQLEELRAMITPDGQIWVSWPKKGSGKETALDQAAVQKIGLDKSLVDIKKCAVDAVWSGLKFVIPKEQR